MFFDDFFQEPFNPYPYKTRAQSPREKLPNGIDGDLARALVVMKRFCSQINSAAEAGHKLPDGILLDTMASVMYRLFDMAFEADSVNEAIRLGLLAFCSDIFLRWPDVKFSYIRFGNTYKDCLLCLESMGSASSDVWLWLLMIGAISTFTEQDDTWLKPRIHQSIKSCGIKSWSETRDVLASFLWIGLVHDRPGKQIFDSTLSST